MSLIQSKIYNDGSHYIAIPQENFPRGKGCKKRRKAIPSPEQLAQKEKFESVYTESKKLPYKQRDAFINKQLILVKVSFICLLLINSQID